MNDPASNNAVILFDGVCNLCSGAVQFVLQHDNNGYFRFASLQSDAGQKLLEQYKLSGDNLGTIVLIENGRAFTRSTAALRVTRRLRWPYSMISVARIVPSPLRDSVYAFIARNRYKWFGKTEQCMIPKPEYARRFLE
ncbi:thiol-disulfide oxidoreductase DCC family protein [Paenibacillus pasadenensis]|uniref:thiol-disulfide oxidoreductase DCC family protein n=1 Tax=Paenibacillus pasadenensis TaxID=217090 RepID=UPI0020414BC8|nr:thiol-disulfide oxidoreductase DCC family protein [Paenibacillus pasadenensis]MCM3748209.1 thiol-disulfide oxidoreductase DCC family protein [Paenibacillus pasadenensis]